MKKRKIQSVEIFRPSLTSDNDTIGIGGTDIADGVVNGAVILIINKEKIIKSVKPK